MRLICPNCGAQYEVPDQVIPFDGRDVQCSNCGNTWFQDHPDNPQPEQASGAEAGWEDDADAGADAAFEDDPYGDPPDPEVDDPLEEDRPAPRETDPSVTDVLREEAEREARLRAEEDAGGLESQPDLGLEPPADDARRRAEEARARMARLRGEAADAPTGADPEPELESRRGLLPDIEEINSSLKSTDNAVATTTASGETPAAAPARKSSGFSRGFMLALVIAVLALLIYNNAPQISAAVPQVDPALNAYVAAIDNARLWLDQQMAALTPQE
ncbi:MAG: zinc-ribbon domain-containing protein [Paracoccaceae bacterium]